MKLVLTLFAVCLVVAGSKAQDDDYGKPVFSSLNPLRNQLPLWQPICLRSTARNWTDFFRTQSNAICTTSVSTTPPLPSFVRTAWCSTTAARSSQNATILSMWNATSANTFVSRNTCLFLAWKSSFYSCATANRGTRKGHWWAVLQS